MKDVALEVLEAVMNLVWFGAWLYIVFGLHQSGWWLLVPLFFHFKREKGA